MKTSSLRLLGAAAISFALASLGTMPAFSQAVPAAAPAYTPEQLEKLVGPIALYPDELLAITLPSATYPLDLVKGQRFLDKRKKDPKAEPDKSLPDSVLKLLNYPDVVKLMNDDLDWTEALGEAVDTDEAGVMNAIQAFRRRAEGAGNLKSNDKQVVIVEKEVIVIQPANPEVIYVPQYQPSSVVVYSSTPYAWGYYPTPYPSYYYPYAPGAALATGLIVGAAIGGAWGMGWNNGHIENNVNINRNTNINTGNRPSQGGGGQNWRNDRAPTQTKAGAQARQGNVGSRPGDARAGGGASARPASTGAASSRASSSASNYGGSRPSGSAGSMQNRSGSSASGGSAFSGAGSSGASANRASSRGASSMSSSPARSASRPSGGGGGARGGGGGGGGGRGGGGRR
jgi:hypothetical protein